MKKSDKIKFWVYIILIISIGINVFTVYFGGESRRIINELRAHIYTASTESEIAESENIELRESLKSLSNRLTELRKIKQELDSINSKDTKILASFDRLNKEFREEIKKQKH